MNRKRTIRLTLSATSAMAALLSWSLPAVAQCALCKTAVTGSPEAAKLSQSLNFAIIILLIPPVLIFCAMFILAFRYRKSRETESMPTAGEQIKGRRGWLAKSFARRKRKENGKARRPGGAVA